MEEYNNSFDILELAFIKDNIYYTALEWRPI